MLKSTRPAYLFPAGFLFGLAVAAIVAVTVATLLGSTLIIRPTTSLGAVQPAPARSNGAPAAAAPGKGVNGFVPLSVSTAQGVTSAVGTRSGPGVNGFVPLSVSAALGVTSAGGTRSGPGVNGFVPLTVSARNSGASTSGVSSAQAAGSSTQDVTPAFAARGINGFTPPGARTGGASASSGSSTPVAGTTRNSSSGLDLPASRFGPR